MIALLKIEWIKTWRFWMTFVLSIGMPVFFFLFSQVWNCRRISEEQKSACDSLHADNDSFFYVKFWIFLISSYAC